MKEESVEPISESSEDSDAIRKNVEEAAAELGLNDRLEATEESPEELKKAQGIESEEKPKRGRPRKQKEEQVSDEPEEIEAGAETDDESDEVQPDEEEVAGTDDESEQLEEEDAEESDEDPVAPPHFWDAEKKKLFAGASPKLQRAIVEDMAQHEEYRRELLEKNQGYEQAIGGIQSAIEPIAPEMQAANLDPIQTLDRFVGWHRLMSQGGYQGLQHAITFLQRYGYTPEMLTQGYEEQIANGYDPRVQEAIDNLERTQAEARAFIEQQQNAQKSWQDQQIQSDIQAFKTETDEDGNLVHPHADFYEAQIARTAAQMRQRNPGMSRPELLRHAYKFTMQQVEKQTGRSLTQKTQQVQKKKVEQVSKQAEKAKIAASVSVKGSPSNGKGKIAASSVEEAFEDSWNELGFN